MSIYRSGVLLAVVVAVVACVVWSVGSKKPHVNMSAEEIQRAALFHHGVEKIYQGFRR